MNQYKFLSDLSYKINSLLDKYPSRKSKTEFAKMLETSVEVLLNTESLKIMSMITNLQNSDIMISETCGENLISEITLDDLVGGNKNVIFSCATITTDAVKADSTGTSCPKNKSDAIKIEKIKNINDEKRVIYEALIHHTIQYNILRTNMSPCIIKFKDIFKCSTEKFKDTLRQLENTNNILSYMDIHYKSDQLMFIATEKVDGSMDNIIEMVSKLIQGKQGDMLRKLFTKRKIDIRLIIESLILQTLFTLMAIQNIYPEFRHNDLHCGNIFIENTIEKTSEIDSKSRFLRFSVRRNNSKIETIYDIPNYGFVAKIADFGLSNLSIDQSTPVTYDSNSGMSTKPCYFYDYNLFLRDCEGRLRKENFTNTIIEILNLVPNLKNVEQVLRIPLAEQDNPTLPWLSIPKLLLESKDPYSEDDYLLAPFMVDESNNNTDSKYITHKYKIDLKK